MFFFPQIHEYWEFLSFQIQMFCTLPQTKMMTSILGISKMKIKTNIITVDLCARLTVKQLEIKDSASGVIILRGIQGPLPSFWSFNPLQITAAIVFILT